MKWYLTKIIFRIITQQEDGDTGLFEEKLRLVKGENKQDALQNAIAWGEEEASEFINASGKKIVWQFIAVPELHTFSGLEEDAELDSHLIEMPVADNFTALQKEKQKVLLQQIENMDNKLAGLVMCYELSKQEMY